MKIKTSFLLSNHYNQIVMQIMFGIFCALFCKTAESLQLSIMLKHRHLYLKIIYFPAYTCTFMEYSVISIRKEIREPQWDWTHYVDIAIAEKLR